MEFAQTSVTPAPQNAKSMRIIIPIVKLVCMRAGTVQRSVGVYLIRVKEIRNLEFEVFSNLDSFQVEVLLVPNS